MACTGAGPVGRAVVSRRGSAFSLIELVVVVVIIAIIGAIAIPKISRGAQGAGDSALIGDLEHFRKAIDLFQAEHSGAPPALDHITAQLTLYSDAAGTSAQANPDATHFYGPYLAAIPALPVGQRKGNTGIGVVDGPTIGWIYDQTNGTIRANTSGGELDATGKAYSAY